MKTDIRIGIRLDALAYTLISSYVGIMRPIDIYSSRPEILRFLSDDVSVVQTLVRFLRATNSHKDLVQDFCTIIDLGRIIVDR
jgi:hypothetical protein